MPDNKIKQFYNEINDNKLLSITDLTEIFILPYFRELEVFILNSNRSEENIIPTLSFYAKKEICTLTFRPYSELREIYADLELETELDFLNNYNEYRKIDYLIESVNKFKKDFHVNYVTEYNITVLSKHESFFKLPIFEKLIQLISVIKQASLNMINLSYRESVEDLKNLKQGFHESISETSNIFANFFQKRYKINTYQVERRYNNKTWKSKTYIPERLLENIHQSTKIIEFGNAIYKKIDNNYVLYLPFWNDEKTIYLKYLLILESSNKIPKYIVTNFYKFVNNYVNGFLEKAKREIINNLQREIINIQIDQQYLKDDFIPNDELMFFAEKAFVSILKVTNAFSATLRLYNPHKKSLDLLTETLENEEIINTDIHFASKSILLTREESINVQTFKTKKKGEYIYVQDARNKGIVCRIDSQSELCIPFYFKSIKIGVINFESPMLNGFSKEATKYFLEITQLIEQFLVQILEFNDKNWLSRRSQVYQNFHEIDNIINSEEFPENYKIQLKDLIKKQNISLENNSSSFNELIKFKNNFFESYKNEMIYEVYKNFKNNVIFNINSDVMGLKIRRSIIDSFLIIIKNLIVNQRNHSDKQRDILIININSSMVHIHVQTRPFEDENFNKFFIAPYETNISEIKTHYGLFSIGMLTRHLGGFTYIYPIEDSSQTRIFIKIPLQRSWIM